MMVNPPSAIDSVAIIEMNECPIKDDSNTGIDLYSPGHYGKLAISKSHRTISW